MDKHDGTTSGSLDDYVTHKLAAYERGDALLNDVLAFMRRFVAYPSPHAAIAHVLFLAHTHAMGCWDTTPRIAFLSPEPGSGKSRALEVSELLVPNPVQAINVSPAYMFRRIGRGDGVTLLFDEVDTIFGPRAKENEEIRGVLNAGHRRGAVAGRCVVRGKAVFTEELPAYCAVALAGLGTLPDTILSRSVIVRMRRRAPTEKIEPFRRRLHESEGYALRDRMAAWICRAWPDGVLDVWPTMPDPIQDRDADVWEALLAVADAAGGEWPMLARDAALALVAESKASTPSLGVRLLADLRKVFGEHDRVPTEDILTELRRLEEAPWADLRGKPLDARGLAQRLRPYGIERSTFKLNGTAHKGYTRAALGDAWARYLPSLAGNSVTAETAVTPRAAAESAVTEVTGDPDEVTEDKAPSDAVVTPVTPVTELERKELRDNDPDACGRVGL